MMETNIPIEQVIVGEPDLKRKYPNNQNGKRISNLTSGTFLGGEETNNLAKLDNGPMMSTSEILDFSSGIDSTEYDQP